MTMPPYMLRSGDILYLDGAEDREEAKRTIQEYQEKFETLRNRVERKRQEIQSLSDGVCGLLHLPHVPFDAFDMKLTPRESTALFRFISCRKSTRIGTEWEHSSIDVGDDCVPAFDACDCMYYCPDKLKLMHTYAHYVQSIYGMDALPANAGLVSYIVVTILMCLITYVLVFYLPSIKEASSRSHSRMRDVIHTRKQRLSAQPVNEYQTNISAGKQADTMA